MLALNEDGTNDDDDVSDYYTITTCCQNGVWMNGSCHSCAAPVAPLSAHRAFVCFIEDRCKTTCRALKHQMKLV